MSRKSIRLVSNKIVTIGEPPFDGYFTLEMADALMNDVPDRAIDIMTNLSPASATQLMTIVRLDKKLMIRYKELVDYSKEKKSSNSAPFHDNELLDEIFVFCPPISSIVFLIDGRRFIREDPDNVKQTVTFEEYEKKYGESVSTTLDRILVQKTSILERACLLVKATPQPRDVIFANNDCVFDKRVVCCDRLQVESFASRSNATVLSIEEGTHS